MSAIKERGLQYAVVSKRVGQRQKRKLFATRKGADRRLTLLGPEPWIAFDKEPDERRCCDGHMCGCNGETYREEAARIRTELPALEYVRLETREVSEWADASAPSSRSTTTENKE